MIHRGVATFTLDSGKCPPWLFERMVKLGRGITEVLVDEFGPDEFIRRIADPVWFQSLGTVLAFDWNASGLTTILTAALKEAIRGEERRLGVFICGGKGKTSRRTPEEIARWGAWLRLPPGATDGLAYNSKMAAKVDSALVQDGFQIYHHSFFFSENGTWSVVQQGMNTDAGAARRYHWFSESAKDLVQEPHAAIASEALVVNALNLVSRKSEKTRTLSVEMVQAGLPSLMKDVTIIRKHSSALSRMISLKYGKEQLALLKLEDTEFRSHPVIREDFTKSRYLDKVLARVTAAKPKNYEALVALEGVGPKTVRALALVGEVIYGAKPSYEDPARYSFAHGGKDATPYPVDRPTYDETIAILQRAIRRAGWDIRDKDRALRRLAGRRSSIY
ncbi:MAG: hypothetical protein A3B37_02270 [Candidatus Sungbacteria bacterium RIFCSPLOWO2_01_FULL_59_16]|uniref:DUF763 domain-containing protein n=1 Tax=Candidatus Sungbacteria bacterium RIFCSPLOWO2_01_FULL_59_16 TaxID=1802280 RepID=A0A1G2LCK1_9BACT|nr:MAG: hypothetical protein A3B37_02270 [Candidatus Sungbacteria bacterium RIFCSPLOWO2_01_FULL_59_16]